MSHELSINEKGEAEMFSAGTVPWHGLGTVLPERVNSEQAIDAAHLDWRVDLKDVFTSDGTLCEMSKATVRQDNGKVLGIVGNRYCVCQNNDAFRFFDSVVGSKEAMYESAGALFEGRKIWILAKLPGTIRLENVPGDEVKKYLLFANSFDGSSSIRMFFTPVRVVCNNTLTAAMNGGKGEGISIRHTESAEENLDLARETLGFALKQYDKLDKTFNLLASRRLSSREAEKYFKTLVPDNPEAEHKTRTENIRQEMLDIFHNEKNSLPGMEQTAWAAYNAVSEYTDHHRNVNGGRFNRNKAMKRMDSIVFGSGARLKMSALREANKIAVN